MKERLKKVEVFIGSHEKEIKEIANAAVKGAIVGCLIALVHGQKMKSADHFVTDGKSVIVVHKKNGNSVCFTKKHDVAA